MSTFTEKNLTQLTATTLNHLIGSKAYVVLCNAYGTVRIVIPLESFCFKPTASNGITFSLPNGIQLLDDEVFNLLNDKFVPLFTAKVSDMFGIKPKPAEEVNLHTVELKESDGGTIYAFDQEEMGRLVSIERKLQKQLGRLSRFIAEAVEADFYEDEI